jgi:hypothetical protein
LSWNKYYQFTSEIKHWEMCFNLFMHFLKNHMKKPSLHHMLIVFDSKSSLTHYTFDKIKFLSQLHICIALLNISFLKIYVQKLTCCSWKLGFRGIIFSARKLQECRILHHLHQGPQTPCRKAISSRWGRVVTLHQTLIQIWVHFILR